MRRRLLVGIAFALCGIALSRAQSSTQPPVTEFAIGRRFFFDFGPPNDFYELFLVRSVSEKTAVERITLTPAGINRCVAPPKVEEESAVLDKSITELLGKTNPCAIPEKELRRELKRCKKCQVFSGASVTMQVDCGARSRLIRADVLDRDMFDPTPRTPQHTSWTMKLLDQLEAPLGPGVVHKPVFPIPIEPEPISATVLNPGIAQELAAGTYDGLFPGGPDKPSKLYEQALQRPPLPTVELVRSSPIAPDVFVAPKYPPIARLTRTEGEVSFTVQIDENGVVTSAKMDDGPPLLGGTATEAVRSWKFPKGDPGREAVVVLRFAANCPRQTN